jgi:hypothetical protein
MFGGGSDGQDTWVWDGQNWTMTHYAKPPVRGYFAMVFDAKRGKTVLFGGHDNLKFCSGGASTNCQDTWEWDGGSWQLASMAGPSARYYHAMAYDCARKKAVLFGGRDDDKICSNGVSIRCQDTWEWDGSNWQLVSTTGPSARYGHAMAYDSARGKVVMFGGNGVTNDTWEWDGSSWQLASTTGPSARSYHAMAYDSARGNILLFGGSSGSDETWEWDGNKWQQVMDASPSERRMHAMAYDSGRGKAVLFGGRDISKQCSGGVSEQCSDIWEWDGVNWQNIPATGPASRYSHAMAFNGTNGNVVMYGGHDSSKQCSDNVSEECPDTWEWNGISWQQKFISGPPARKAHAMAYDSDLNKIVLFSGADSSTACSGGTGQYCPDTWLYDGNAWQLFSNEGPTAREYHSMAYDSGRHKVVLFGGLIDGSHKGDTWEWDGASWEMIQSSAGLGVNSSSTLIYDAARRKILQFGGYYAGNETWEWNGINWKNVSLDGPSSRMRHAMVYDSIRERGVLFGGSSGGDETWEWTANNEKPAQVMQIVLYGSNIPLDRIKNVSAIFNSGGTGYSGTDCSAVHGTKLFTWNTAVNAGSWVEVANNTSSSGSPTNLSFSTTDMNLIKQLIIGRNSNTINLAIVPFSVNGCAAQMAAVKTNSAEVLIKYYLSD